MSNNKLFKKRVYGAVIIKSKLANYNADFTGSPRTLPDGTVYATDKVLKFKIRDYLEKDGKKIFVKTKYKANGNPMTLEEVYKFHFGEDAKDKIITLRNLLSMLDVRLFGATFAKKGDNNLNLSIHGPVQISYGVNRFDEMKDSGVFTDQIGSQFASDTKGSQTTLGSQTRSFEAHYVHQFSINPNNLKNFVEQVLLSELTVTKKANKKEVLDKKEIENKINNELQDEDFKKELVDKLNKDDLTIENWKNFIQEKIKENFLKFKAFQLLTEDDVKCLKNALQVAVTSYDSTSKKDVENEFLLWVELSENLNVVLRNFTELIEIKKDNDRHKIKINLEKVFEYLEKFKEQIKKIEIYYDDSFTEIKGVSKDWDKDKIEKFDTLGNNNKLSKKKSGDNE